MMRKALIAVIFFTGILGCATPQAQHRRLLSCSDRGGRLVDAGGPMEGMLVTVLRVRCKLPDERSWILV